MSKKTTELNRSKTTRNRRTPPPPSSDENTSESDENHSDISEEEDDSDQLENQNRSRKSVKSKDRSQNITDEEDKDKSFDCSQTKRSIKIKSRLESSSSKQDSNYWKYPILLIAIAIPIIYYLFSNEGSDVSSTGNDWRSKVDPNDILPRAQQNLLRASLKPILDKSSTEEGVSTLLILSSNEEQAAKLARCILNIVNRETHKAQVPTEINLLSYPGGKLGLDSSLRSLLNPGGKIRAVLLRHIDDNSAADTFERARLLFAYCDGENPVIPHRLIIMTATSHSENESELREKFKNYWPKEHDFVDALMSRISGHTLYVQKPSEIYMLIDCFIDDDNKKLFDRFSFSVSINKDHKLF